MTTALYALGKAAISRGDVDLESADIRAIPVTAAYTPNFTTHEDMVDVGAGARAVAYADAQILTAKTLSTASGKVTFDADDLTFPGVASGDDIVALLVYVHTGTESTSILLGYFDYFANLPLTPDTRDVVFAFPGDANKVFSW